MCWPECHASPAHAGRPALQRAWGVAFGRAGAFAARSWLRGSHLWHPGRGHEDALGERKAAAAAQRQRRGGHARQEAACAVRARICPRPGAMEQCTQQASRRGPAPSATPSALSFGQARAQRLSASVAHACAQPVPSQPAHCWCVSLTRTDEDEQHSLGPQAAVDRLEVDLRADRPEQQRHHLRGRARPLGRFHAVGS